MGCRRVFCAPIYKSICLGGGFGVTTTIPWLANAASLRR